MTEYGPSVCSELPPVDVFVKIGCAARNELKVSGRVATTPRLPKERENAKVMAIVGGEVSHIVSRLAARSLIKEEKKKTKTKTEKEDEDDQADDQSEEKV